MSTFRKKPIVIEAWQASANLGSAPPWLTERFGRDIQTNGGLMPFYIKTLEGVMAAEEGDWIIKGVKGELYPCKPDIFAATYEAADDACEPNTAV
jgi:hypothetical protein